MNQSSTSSTHNLICSVNLIFFGFLSVGVPIAILPPYLHESLGFSTTLVGFIVGIQSLATLLTRHYAGTLSDLRGGKRSVLFGVLLTSLSALITLTALQIPTNEASTVIYVLARVCLGLGESLLVTGALAWGVGLLGPQNAGRVMIWNGMAMYAAIAAAAPLGLFIKNNFGMSTLFVGMAITPFVGWASTLLLDAPPISGKERMPFYKVLNVVWKSGVGLSFSAVGFAGLASFAILYFKQNNWENASLVMTTFGAAFILARVFFSHVPDKYGGAKVAFVCVLIEALGQLLLWTATNSELALVGAALTGFGYSLAFPGFGVEAVRNAPPQNKGVALGAFVAFFDLALAITGPLAGFVANYFSYSSVYLFGMISCLMAAVITLTMKSAKI